MKASDLKDSKEIIHNLVTTNSLNKYAYIMQNFQKTDIAQDLDFQKRFNGFYIVRRNAEWRAAFYELFEKCKLVEPTFDMIITAIYEKTGQVEASFASKMLATFQPDMPIWDSLVLKHLNLKLKGANKVKLQNAIHLYQAIVQWYQDNLESGEYTAYINDFNHTLPEYKWFSNTKKLDFIIWGNGRIKE